MVEHDCFTSKAFERNEQLQILQWDTVDSRLLAAQIESRNEKDAYDSSIRIESFFVTKEAGIRAYERVNMLPEWKALAGLKTPYFVFEST